MIVCIYFCCLSSIIFKIYIYIFFLVLVLDAVDNSGETHLQVDHNIYKRRLNLEGQPISDPEKSNGKIKFKLLMI